MNQPSPPRTLPAGPRLHRGLAWLTGEPDELAELLRDPQLAQLVVARPHPRALGFPEGAVEKVMARLAKLGTVPRRVEGR